VRTTAVYAHAAILDATDSLFDGLRATLLVVLGVLAIVLLVLLHKRGFSICVDFMALAHVVLAAHTWLASVNHVTTTASKPPRATHLQQEPAEVVRRRVQQAGRQQSFPARLVLLPLGNCAVAEVEDMLPSALLVLGLRELRVILFFLQQSDPRRLAPKSLLRPD